MTKTMFTRSVRVLMVLGSIQFSLGLMAQTPTAAPTATAACSNSTLNGTYKFVQSGNLIGTNGTRTQIQVSGTEVFDGKGNSHGSMTTTTVANGNTTSAGSTVTFTGVYTMSPNCTVTKVVTDANNNVFHFTQFIGRNASQMTSVQIDSGMNSVGSETSASAVAASSGS